MSIYQVFGRKTVLAALVLGCSAVGNAASQGATFDVTVNGNTFTLTTVEGSFNDNEALLESQPWWLDEALTDAFATELQGGLGFPHVGSGNLGPLFAWSEAPTFVVAKTWRQSDSSLQELSFGRDQTTFVSGAVVSPLTWTVVVPEPATIALGGAGLLLFAAKRRRRSQVS